MNWQPIETAPKDGTWFLGFSLSEFLEDQIQVWHWRADVLPEFQGWQNAADTCDYPEEWPTHWMPLPEPPHEKTPPTEADGK